MMTDFAESDMGKLRLILKRLYKLNKETYGAFLGYSGESWPNCEACFILSTGDKGTSHSITFRLNKKDRLRTMSVYQFLVEEFTRDLVKEYYPALERKAQIKIRMAIVEDLLFDCSYTNIIKHMFATYMHFIKNKRSNGFTISNKESQEQPNLMLL
jgi:hypothetical protein